MDRGPWRAAVHGVTRRHARVTNSWSFRLADTPQSSEVTATLRPLDSPSTALGPGTSDPGLRESCWQSSCGLDSHLGPGPVTVLPAHPHSKLEGQAVFPLPQTLENDLPFPYFYSLTHHQPSYFLGFTFGFHFERLYALGPWRAAMNTHHGRTSNEFAAGMNRNPFPASSNTSRPRRRQTLTLPLHVSSLTRGPYCFCP